MFAAFLAFMHEMSTSCLPLYDRQKCFQMLLMPSGGQNCLQVRTTILERQGEREREGRRRRRRKRREKKNTKEKGKKKKRIFPMSLETCRVRTMSISDKVP